jgi:outer membrane protein assembly factor BamB
MRLVRCLPLFFLPACLSLAADWPQWRGPVRDGTLPGVTLPERLPEKLPLKWKQPIGGGYGGVAVAGGRVYVMDRQKEPREVERVLCFDADSGKPLWSHSYPVAYGKLDYGNGPRSTPTVHDGRVYTFGALAHLHCLDAVTGKVLWQVDGVADLKARIPTWGHSCSPLIDGERLLVQMGAPDGCLMAFEYKSGKEVWRGLGDPPGYASPTILRTDTFRRLVYWTPDNIVGLDPEDGKVCWKVPFPITYGVSISDIVWDGRTILASNYWTGSKALKLDAKGDNPELAWEGKALSLLMSTPLVRAGKVYAIDRFRGLKCLELTTGKVLWEGEMVVERGSNPQASLIGAGSRVLLFNDRGELILGDLQPTGFKNLGTAKVLPGKPWAHHAYADGRVYARTDEEIVCIEVPR